MPDSLSDQLRQELVCESLLECFYGLTQLDREVFRSIVERDAPVTVDEIADAVDRERSTAHRSVQRLLDAGFVRKAQINYETGGYYYVFEATDTDDVAREMQRLLDDWYATMEQLIGQYRETYGDASTAATTAES